MRPGTDAAEVGAPPAAQRRGGERDRKSQPGCGPEPTRPHPNLSEGRGILEHMFEQPVSPPEVIAWFDELFERHYPSTTPESAALLDRICASWRTENRAAAASLAAIGELFGYRLARCSDTEDWAIDTEAAVSAEVAAAFRMSQGLAASPLRYGRP